MSLDEIKSRLEGEFQECEVEGADGHFTVRVISDAFAGLSKLKRQQAVYKVLNDMIASGEIHAISMKTLTPEEKQAADG